MKFLRFLSIFTLLFALTTLIASYSLLQLVATGSSMSDTLNSGGAYTLIADQARTSLGSSPKVPAKYEALFTASLEKAVDTKHIETMLKPAIVDIATWFDQPAGTPAPDVIIVVKPAKDDLIQQLSDGGLTKIELATLQSELSQQIPDQIRLSSLQDLVGGSSTSQASTTKSGTPTNDSILKVLDQIKTAVSTIRMVFYLSCIVSLVMTGIIAVLSHRLGRSWTKALAITYGSVGIFWLLTALLVPIMFQPSTATVSADTIIMHMTPVLMAHLLAASLFPASICLLLAAIGVAISLFRRTKTPQNQPPRVALPTLRQK